MTVEDVKKLARKNLKEEITDAEAEAVLKECVKEGLLSDDELLNVSGGLSGHAGETVSLVLAKMRELMKNRPHD